MGCFPSFNRTESWTDARQGLKGDKCHICGKIENVRRGKVRFIKLFAEAMRRLKLTRLYNGKFAKNVMKRGGGSPKKRRWEFFYIVTENPRK